MKSSPLIVSLAFLLLPAWTATAEEWGEFTREELFATHFPEAPQADAVVLLDHGVARIDSKNRLKVRHHKRTKIFKEAAVDQEVRIRFRKDDEIKEFKAHTVIPPGQRIKVENKHVREESHGDWKVKIFTFPDVAPGAIVEYTYELRSDRLDVLKPWTFHNDHYTRKSRFELMLPNGYSYHGFFGWVAGAEPRPQKDKVNDVEDVTRRMNRAVWEITDLEPLGDLPLVSYENRYETTLYVQLERFESEMKSYTIGMGWDDHGEAFAKTYEKVWKSAKGLDDWAEPALAGATTPQEKAAALHAHVTGSIATVPASVPASEIRLDQVVKSGQGSALAKNLLLVQLLRQEGMGADPVLIRTRDLGEFQPRYRNPEQLNHQIIRVTIGAETYFADASAQWCPFGALPPNHHVSQGVLVTRQGGEIIPITVPVLASSRTVDTDGKLEASGALTGTTVWTWTGYGAIDARHRIATSGENEFARELLAVRFPGSTVEAVQVTGLTAASEPLTVEVRYRDDDFAAVRGDQLTYPVPFFLAENENPLPAKDRDVPVEFSYPEATEENVTMQVPDGFLRRQFPKNARSNSSEMSFSSTFAFDQGVLQASRKMEVKEPLVEKQKYLALQGQYAKLVESDGSMVVLRKQPVRANSSR